MTIDALDRGIDVLEVIAERGSVRLAELPELLSVSRATAFRVLKTLEERGYVEHVRSERVYRLGPGPVILAARSQTSSIVSLAGPAMAELRDAIGETVNLALFRGGRVAYVEILDGYHALRLSVSVGEEAPLHATALGKAALAALTPDRRRQLLPMEPFPAYTDRTLTTWEQLDDELEVSQARGYTLELEESAVGVVCVGAAIIGKVGYPIGALSASGLSARFAKYERQEAGKRVAEWCRRISTDFGYSDSSVG